MVDTTISLCHVYTLPYRHPLVEVQIVNTIHLIDTQSPDINNTT
jgi:hypothetical protein